MPRAKAKTKHGQKTKRAKVRKRPRQQALPGTDKFHADIDARATRYADARDTRMELTVEEKKRHDSLMSAMKGHNLKRYRTRAGDEVEILTERERVCVRRAKGKGRD